VLADDAVRLAAVAARDDVDVALQVTAGAAHVFQNNFGLLEEADQALDDVARFTRRYLS
jgi:epsilon-lactone hydrolase